MDGAADLYDKFWNDSGEYTERNGICYKGVDEPSITAISSLKEEFGDFEEYCTDSCGCDEGEAAEEDDDDNGDTLMIIGIVVGAVLLIIIIVVVVLVMKNRKLKESTETAQHTAGQPSSETMTNTQTEQKIAHVPATSSEVPTAGETAS